jgi:tetratricopeptide (TPR) repeat protein
MKTSTIIFSLLIIIFQGVFATSTKALMVIDFDTNQIESLQKTSQNNNAAVTYFRLGNIKAESGDFKGAITDYNKSIEMNPNYSYAYSNRGLAKHKSGDKKGAIRDLSKAAELLRRQGKTIHYEMR